MLCPSCEFGNPDGMKFCGECASQLTNPCPKCGMDNPPGFKFCGECATSLTAAAQGSLTCPKCGQESPPRASFCLSCAHPFAAAETPSKGPLKTPTAVPEAAPTSFANGRYTVSRFLGEGGNKKVYLAQDTLLDRDVAFALIKTVGLDDVARTRISREAQAMGRLGSHPHIVTVFDLGEHPTTGSGQPSQRFMVTELMGGGDVEGVGTKATSRSEVGVCSDRPPQATSRGATTVSKITNHISLPISLPNFVRASCVPDYYHPQLSLQGTDEPQSSDILSQVAK